MSSRAGGRGQPGKLVLCVIDGACPDMLARAVQQERAPAIAAVIERGTLIDDLIAGFPSVTPLCTSSIATGAPADRHLIPGMCWFLRGEARYVDYGSSFQASRTVGFGRSLTDLIYNLNLSHLSRNVLTFFESLDDADLRTAGTSFLIYRGRHRHPAAGDTALARLVTQTLFRHGVWGPRELFYADLFASRVTPCSSQLGLPGARDAHAGCVGAQMVEEDLCDFMLLSLPDNDFVSHRDGPEAQLEGIAAADAQLQRVLEAGGGVGEFLERNAVIVLADHAHSAVEHSVSLSELLEDWRVLHPNDLRPEEAELAVCPNQRAAIVYVLDVDPTDRDVAAREVIDSLRGGDGVDLLMAREGDRALVVGREGELRFAPGGDVRDGAGRGWSIEGEPGVVGGELRRGRLRTPDYPDALDRVWSALACRRSGEVLVSALPGWEFVDWGGMDHVGGGSHGSLHRDDSLTFLAAAGAGPRACDERAQWTLCDVRGMVEAHFGVD